MSKGVTNELSRTFGEQVSYSNGILSIHELPLQYARSVAGLTSLLARQSGDIKFPIVSEREKEIVSLGQLLTRSLLENKGEIHVIAPVCPDYSQEDSESFYKTIGGGISPQAYAAIRSAFYIDTVFPKFGFKPTVEIIVANTEDDIPEIMQRFVQGNMNIYQNCCISSVHRINQLVSNKSISASTFTSFFSFDFQKTQYLYEQRIRSLMIENKQLYEEIVRLGERRTKRHAKILGRSEKAYELTIRYMAQYAALGTLIRKTEKPTIILNYPSPNLPFINAANYRTDEFSLSEMDKLVIPVLETVL